MAEVALASGCGPIGVVLGAHAEVIQPHLVNLDLIIIHNSAWPTGMASSIRCGLQALLALSPALDAIALMVCDQPLVSAELLQQFLRAHRATAQPIVAAEYANILGVPALFHKTLFADLAQLQGDRGAQSLLRQHRGQCLGIPFPPGVLDIDTPEDLSMLTQVGRPAP
jgi:molybdenum cofactor cytidylyltransferase